MHYISLHLKLDREILTSFEQKGNKDEGREGQNEELLRRRIFGINDVPKTDNPLNVHPQIRPTEKF